MVHTKILKFFVAFLAAVLAIGVFSAVDLRTLVGVFVNDEGLNTIFLNNEKESKLFAKEHMPTRTATCSSRHKRKKKADFLRIKKTISVKWKERGTVRHRMRK